jgi:hypothetical protein
MNIQVYVWCRGPWNSVFLGKLIVVQLVKKCIAFYVTRNFITLCSREPVTGPCPEAEKYSPHPHTLFEIHFNIVLPFTLKSPEWPLLAKILHSFHISPMRAACFTRLILIDFSVLFIYLIASNRENFSNYRRLTRCNTKHACCTKTEKQKNYILLNTIHIK